MTQIICLHGPTCSIVIERGPQFLQYFYQEINRLQQSSHAMSTVYHSQTDGQPDYLEAINKCVKKCLRCFVVNFPTYWVAIGQVLVQHILSMFVGMTPFWDFCGHEPPK